MPKEDTQFNSETGRIAGKKSKRKSFDSHMKELINEIFADSKDELIISAIQQFKKGNHKPLAYLMDRGLGKPTSYQVTQSLNPEDNPLYKQLKELTKQNKK